MLPITDRNSFFAFISEYADADPSTLRLKWHNHSEDCGFDISFAITQIECRKKYRKKLKETLAANPKFIFPDTLAGEQSTSDALAAWHATMIHPDMVVVDLTAGLGIDAMHLAKQCSHVIAIEKDQRKYECLRENVSAYTNIDVINADSTDIPRWLPALKQLLAGKDASTRVLFYVDPARRGSDGSRVFAIGDCTPDITTFYPLFADFKADVLVKLSPMLDITALLSVLPSLQTVYSVGNTTECKEVFCHISYGGHAIDTPHIEAITLDADGHVMSSLRFTKEAENKCVARIWDPASQSQMRVIYIPRPSVMKASPMSLLTEMFDIYEIHANTHLFLAEGKDSEFPGEQYEIEEFIPYESKHIKRLNKKYPEICVTARNFGISSDALRRKLRVREGGDRRLFAVTASDNTKWMIVTK